MSNSKQVVHFKCVRFNYRNGNEVANQLACGADMLCWWDTTANRFHATSSPNEVTCGNCKRTNIYRKENKQ